VLHLPMVGVLERDLAYAAGLFDGEGCCYVPEWKQRGFGPYYYAFLCIDMPDEEPIKWLLNH
jgi:hypothetical protein